MCGKVGQILQQTKEMFLKFGPLAFEMLFEFWFETQEIVENSKTLD